VGRLTLNSAARSRSEGKRAPGSYSPDLISVRMASATWRYSLRVSGVVLIARDLERFGSQPQCGLATCGADSTPCRDWRSPEPARDHRTRWRVVAAQKRAT